MLPNCDLVLEIDESWRFYTGIWCRPQWGAWLCRVCKGAGKYFSFQKKIIWMKCFFLLFLLPMNEMCNCEGSGDVHNEECWEREEVEIPLWHLRHRRRWFHLQQWALQGEMMMIMTILWQLYKVRWLWLWRLLSATSNRTICDDDYDLFSFFTFRFWKWWWGQIWRRTSSSRLWTRQYFRWSLILKVATTDHSYLYVILFTCIVL